MKKRFVLVLGLVLGSNVNAIDKDKVNKILECEMPADQEVRHEKELRENYYDDKSYNMLKRIYEGYKSWWDRGSLCDLKYRAYDEIVDRYGILNNTLDWYPNTTEDLMDKVQARYNKYLNERY